MSDHDRPSISATQPGIPPPPPVLDRRSLWISLLLPPGVMVIATIIFMVSLKASMAKPRATLLNVLCVVLCLSCAAGWDPLHPNNAQALSRSSLAILVIAYPITQTILLLSTFFVGCLRPRLVLGLH